MIAIVVFTRYHISMKNNQTNRVLTLLERLARVINNDASMSVLKPAQWEALRFFNQANRFSSNPSALTAYMDVTKGTVSQTIIALERKGLVKKNKVKEDRRAVNIEVTTTGLEVLNEDPLQELALCLEQITSKKLEVLSSTLEELLLKTIEHRGSAPFGVCKTCQYFKRNSNKGSPHLCSLLEAPLSEKDSHLICREHSS